MLYNLLNTHKYFHINKKIDKFASKYYGAMKVTLLQRDILWNNPAENRRRVNVTLNKYQDTDLFVLPEMWTTGFSVDPHEGLEGTDGDSLHWMQNIAQEKGCAICGSVSISEADGCHNRFYFVKPNGTFSSYDKRHLFTYGGEDKHYIKGNKRVVVDYLGFRILLLVCYDLRFPVWSRCNDDFDMMIYVANWPVSRVDVWTTLLKARALENQCYVIGVNRVGTDPYCPYCGCSMAYDAYGKIIARCNDNEECETTFEINLEKQNVFRKKFPVLNDRDTFNLEYNKI